MTLEQIIREGSKTCPELSIRLCRESKTVVFSGECINSTTLRGEDGEAWIEHFDALIEASPDVTLRDAMKYLAAPFVGKVLH